MKRTIMFFITFIFLFSFLGPIVNIVDAETTNPTASAELLMRPEYEGQVKFTGTKTVSSTEWDIYRITLDTDGATTIFFDASNSSAQDGSYIDTYQWKILFDAPYGDDDFPLEGHTFTESAENGSGWSYNFKNSTIDSTGDNENTIRMELVTIDINGNISEKFRMFFVIEPGTLPSASISSFDARAGKGGALIMNWNVSFFLFESDFQVVTICDWSYDCYDPLFITHVAPGVNTYTYSGANTNHGTTYIVRVEICNSAGCSTPMGEGTIIADKEVDGGVSAMQMVIQEVGEEWTVSWAIHGETFDVDHWNVCYQKQESFDAANMPSQCVSTTSATDTTINISMPTVEGTWYYHFTAVPVDALGNYAPNGAMNSIEYHRDVTITDSDQDGVVDGDDAFPNDANETQDTDGDGIGDNSDVFPNDVNETQDTDGDGIGDNSDAFPNDENETHDDDNDGVGNNTDAFPQDANETMDTDQDGVGDNEDPEPENPDVRTPQDISVEISDTSSYLIAGSIMFLALVILFVRRKQPPNTIAKSHFVEDESIWNDS